MSFLPAGVSDPEVDQTGRTTSSKVDVAERKDNKNNTVEFTTHNATQEVTETFVANATNIVNSALAGQVSSAEVIISHEVTEKTDGYNEVSITKKVIVPVATGA